MTDRELMQQALADLKIAEVCGNCNYGATELLLTRLAQPELEQEQEPVAWVYRDSWGNMKLSQIMPPPVGAFPVYTAPPKRAWVGLTQEDILEIAEKLGLADVAWVDLMQAIERRLKRRNT